MADPAKLTIRAGFSRPEPAALAPFREAATGHVVDAQGRRGALAHWVRPMTAETRFVGAALTVRTRAMDNLAPYAALSLAQPGDVLVVAVDGHAEASVMGDVLIGMARNAGIVACVTDGLVRDVAGIEAVGIPCFARGLSPNSPMKDGPGAIGLPVTIGGVMVSAGDLLVGDRDGIAVVAGRDLAATAAGLAAVADKEAAMERAVADGARVPAWLDAVLASDAVRRLD